MNIRLYFILLNAIFFFTNCKETNSNRELEANYDVIAKSREISIQEYDNIKFMNILNPDRRKNIQHKANEVKSKFDKLEKQIREKNQNYSDLLSELENLIIKELRSNFLRFHFSKLLAERNVTQIFLLEYYIYKNLQMEFLDYPLLFNDVTLSFVNEDFSDSTLIIPYTFYELRPLIIVKQLNGDKRIDTIKKDNPPYRYLFSKDGSYEIEYLYASVNLDSLYRTSTKLIYGQ